MTKPNEGEKAVETKEQQEDFGFDPKENVRAKLYEDIDKQRGVFQEVQTEEQDEPDKDLGQRDPNPEPEGDDAPGEERETEAKGSEEEVPETEDAGTADADDSGDPFSPRTLSLDEFNEVFKDWKIKGKVAGQEEEAPVSEWVKGTGLSKHFTKKLQVLADRERKLLEEYSRETGGEETGQDDGEVQEKYDELYAESPYKAQAYLEEVKAKRSSTAQEKAEHRLREAVADFRSAYPECTDADWDRMNDPAFWQKHEDVVNMRSQGAWFPMLVTAYTRLQSGDITREAVVEKQADKKTPQKTERKRAGQVLRTTIKPAPKGKPKEPTIAEERRAYIEELRQAAHARMRIKQ